MNRYKLGHLLGIFLLFLGVIQVQAHPHLRYTVRGSDIKFHSNELCFRYQLDKDDETLIYELLKINTPCKSLEDFSRDKFYLFTIDITNKAKSVKELVFDFGKPGLVYMYKVGKIGLKEKKQAGTLLPQSEKSFQHGLSGLELLSVSVPAASTQRYAIVLKFNGWGNPDYTIGIASYIDWLHISKSKGLLKNMQQGLFHGVVLVLFVMSFYFYLISGEKTALCYAISIFSCSIFLLSVNGYLQLLLPGLNPKWHILIGHVFVVVSIYSYIHFLILYTNTIVRFPVWYKIIIIAEWAMFVSVFISALFLFTDEVLYRYYLLRYISNLAFISLYFIYSIAIMIKGRRHDDIYLVVSSGIIIIGGVITIILLINMPHSLWSYYSYQIAVLLQVFIMAFALINRYRVIIKRKNIYKNQLIKQLGKNESIQKEINSRLEREVHNRTEEILAQNEELTQQQEELSKQRYTLEVQKYTIETQNNKLREYNVELERMVRDRTLKLSESNKAVRRQNVQLEHFSYMMAHNLRAPVAQIKGLVHLIRLEFERGVDCFEIINRLSHSASDLEMVLRDMNEVLQLRRGELPKSEKVNIDDAIKQVMETYAEEIDKAGVDIVKDIKAKVWFAPPTFADKILDNLISNAIRYRKKFEPAKVYISAYTDGNFVCLEVQDNGIGIDLVKSRNRLFGFYQRFNDDKEGKGLGLFIVKNIVEAINGSIHVKSKPGEGATFYVKLPIRNS